MDAATVKNATSRYQYYNGIGGRTFTTNAGQTTTYGSGVCLLKERPGSGNTTMVDNYDVPWMDAGTGGDRVNIVVTYNHPLITPLAFPAFLNLGKYIRMRGVRAAVNESFRITNAERALGPSGALGPAVPPYEPPPAPTTPAPVTTVAPVVPSLTLTSSNTPTPVPFSCDLISVESVTFDQRSFYVRLINNNVQDTYLTHALIYWSPADFQDYPDTYLAYEAVSERIYWQGNASADVSPIDSLDPSKGTNDVNVDRTVPAKGQANWEGYLPERPAVHRHQHQHLGIRWVDLLVQSS